MKGLLLLVVALFTTASNRSTAAQAAGPAPGQTWHYRLLGGSRIIMVLDTGDMPAGVVIAATNSLRGSFDLIGEPGSSPDTEEFAITDIAFIAPTNAAIFSLSGVGTYQESGTPIGFQTMALQGRLGDGTPFGGTGTPLGLTNVIQTMTRSAPIIDVDVSGWRSYPPGTIAIMSYDFHLIAAPFRDLWFSTSEPFTMTYSNSFAGISADDILSLDGRVVKRGADLVESVGIPSLAAGDDGVGTFTVAPGGVFLFSLTHDATNATLGAVQAGDVLSYAGGVLQHNQDLTRAFVLSEYENPVSDHGLDGLQFLANGQFLYSTTNDAVSGTLHVPLQHGDLLSSSGQIARSNAQLLSRFHPTNAPSDLGLKAFYVWPGGEVWFSVERGFQDTQLGWIRPGDLLSDQGFIVFRNEELLQAFAPYGSPEDLGLRGIYVVTDDTSAAPPPHITHADYDPQNRALTLTWQGVGRVFQVEEASFPAGPFSPVSPLLPGESYTVMPITPAPGAAFFRIRQW